MRWMFELDFRLNVSFVLGGGERTIPYFLSESIMVPLMGGELTGIARAIGRGRPQPGLHSYRVMQVSNEAKNKARRQRKKKRQMVAAGTAEAPPPTSAAGSPAKREGGDALVCHAEDLNAGCSPVARVRVPPRTLARAAILQTIGIHCGIHSDISSGFATCLASCDSLHFEVPTR